MTAFPNHKPGFTSMKSLLVLALIGTVTPTHSRLAADPVVFRQSHVDIRITAEASTPPHLDIVLGNEETGVEVAPADAVVEVADAARVQIPEGFDVFGPAGTDLWVLPQTQDPQLTFPGISTEGIAPGVFEPRFRLALVRVEGPGDFFLWQFDASNNPVIRMNSRDEIGPDDVIETATGGHEHFNWGFTTPGLYNVVVRVTNRLVGGSEDIVSDNIGIRFGVVPYALPPAPAQLSGPQWSEGQFICKIVGEPGRTYAVETSGDLHEWTRSSEITTDTNGKAQLSIPATTGHLFIRTRGLR